MVDDKVNWVNIVNKIKDVLGLNNVQLAIRVGVGDKKSVSEWARGIKVPSDKHKKTLLSMYERAIK